MASITVSTGALDALLSSVRKQVEAVWARQKNAAIESAEFGAKSAQSYTASRPGAKTGKAGRIDSGAMVGAIRSRLLTFGPGLIQSQYGFIDEFEDYFKMQTVTGFLNIRSGDKIEPTFALRDSIGPTNDFAHDAAGRAA
ncbi:MAG TPA: hypothetical protein VFL67_10450 [Mycobacterium sp.]|nr:hypothetical protein [Mycobacterium sp.]